MKYVGSKNRLSKELAPIIQSYITDRTDGYFEPFVGGANMIDKIKCKKRIGFDYHNNLIALLKYVQDLDNKLPQHITEEDYLKVRNNKEEYPNWYVGLVGFGATFSARYFEGYARSFKADKITPRDMPNESIRNIEKQRENLTDIIFKCIPFEKVSTRTCNNLVIYCDIPYKVEKYNDKKYYRNTFNYDKFYKWCKEMSRNNIVLISEYNMPEEFECIWAKESKVGINQGGHRKRIERLFRLEVKDEIS